LKAEELILKYQEDNRTELISNQLLNLEQNRIQLKGVIGSAGPLLGAALSQMNPFIHVFVLGDKETAAYFYNDLENLFNEQEKDFHKKKILFFPTSYKRAYEIDKVDNTNLLLRTEVLKRISSR